MVSRFCLFCSIFLFLFYLFLFFVITLLGPEAQAIRLPILNTNQAQFHPFTGSFVSILQAHNNSHNRPNQLRPNRMAPGPRAPGCLAFLPSAPYHARNTAPAPASRCSPVNTLALASQHQPSITTLCAKLETCMSLSTDSSPGNHVRPPHARAAMPHTRRLSSLSSYSSSSRPKTPQPLHS